MVNDIIEELTDLDMEPKPEPLWWTSAHQAEEKKTLSAGKRGRAWDLSFKDAFEVLGYRFHRDGNGCQGADRTFVQRLGQLVARWIHLPVEECAPAYEMSECSQSRLQYCPER